MQVKLQPKRNTLTVVLADGSIYETEWCGAATRMVLSIDATNHPSYTGSRHQQSNMGRSAKFQQKFNI